MIVVIPGNAGRRLSGQLVEWRGAHVQAGPTVYDAERVERVCVGWREAGCRIGCFEGALTVQTRNLAAGQLGERR